MQAIEFEATAHEHKLNLPESIEDGTQLRVLLLIDENAPSQKSTKTIRRRPHPDIEGKTKINGNIFDSSPALDWNLSS